MTKEIAKATKSLIELQKVSANLSNKTIIEDISLSLTMGQIISVVGPNGGGKTTLIKIIAGTFKGQTTGIIKRKPDIKIGYLPQKVVINNAIPMTVARLVKGSIVEKKDPQGYSLNEALALCDISHLQDISVHNLSLGQLQRALLAKSLLGKPDLVILDEPMQGVDIEGQKKIYQALEDYRKKTQACILMVSHDLHLVMANSSTVICIDRTIRCTGLPDAIATDKRYHDLFGLFHHHGTHKKKVKT